MPQRAVGASSRVALFAGALPYKTADICRWRGSQLPKTSLFISTTFQVNTFTSHTWEWLNRLDIDRLWPWKRQWPTHQHRDGSTGRPSCSFTRTSSFSTELHFQAWFAPWSFQSSLRLLCVFLRMSMPLPLGVFHLCEVLSLRRQPRSGTSKLLWMRTHKRV